MNKQIEVLIDKYGLTHLKEELINTVFPCESCAKAGGNCCDR